LKGFPKLEKFDKAKIISALSTIIRKYGLDYEIVLKFILKDNKVLFFLTMAEFISEDQKREIIRIALSKHPERTLLTFLHFPNQMIINEIINIKKYNKDIIKDILKLERDYLGGSPWRGKIIVHNIRNIILIYALGFEPGSEPGF